MKNLPGFTLLELLVVITLIALTSAIVMMNTSFLDKLQTNQTANYETFISYLGEESALKQKKISWFIGNNSQSVKFLDNNNWHDFDNKELIFPKIDPNVIFTDTFGNSFVVSENRKDPFMVFNPIGNSSGGTIEFNENGTKTILAISQSLQYEYLN